jgi:hypothetical protein
MFKFLKQRAFKKGLKKAAADGVVTRAEAQALEAMGVDREFADKAKTEQYQKAIAPIMKEIKKTLRISADQEAQLVQIARNLDIDASFDDTFMMCRELWAAENGEEVRLSPVEADVMLQKGEVCYLNQPATWAQIKTVKTRAGYSGFSTSIRLMKGVSYRVGNIAPYFTSAEQLVRKDVGTLYLTSKRLFFVGGNGSTSVNLSRIGGIEAHVDGIEVTKDRGANDAFLMPQLPSEFCAMAVQQLLSS